LALGQLAKPSIKFEAKKIVQDLPLLKLKGLSGGKTASFARFSKNMNKNF
jgi:hypothetical protein